MYWWLLLLWEFLTGTAAMRVGFSTDRSPLLPFLILLDYNVEARIHHKNITSKILYIIQNDTWQENQGNKTLHRNRVPIHQITERCTGTYLCCHNHWQTCFFQTLHYLLRSEEKSNRCRFHGPNSWFLQQRQKYSCHLQKYRVHCTYVVVSFINFDRDLHAMLFSTYKNSIKSTPSWNAYPIYIQTISYAIAKMLQKCLILLSFV